MKKMKRIFALLVVTVFASVLLTGCSSDHDLVGEWNWYVADIVFYTFNNDDTGVMYPGIDFTWSTSGNTVTIIAEGTEMRWQYSISGDILTLTYADDPTMAFTYRRQ